MNVIVTKSADHIRTCLMQPNLNLQQYDGIICLGGDGTVSEVINGLMFRTMIDLGLNLSNPEYMPKPNLPIGIIPGGSTDTIAYCIHGTTDVITAVLHIICGIVNGLDVSSIYAYTPKHTQSCLETTSIKNNQKSSDTLNDNKNYNLIKFFASIMSYGYLGDLAADSENYRWMGPKRYDWSGFKKFINNKGYNIELTINTDSVGNDNADTENTDANSIEITKEKCVIHCKRCADACDNTINTHSGSNSSVLSGNNWKIIRGNYFMISGANISCACKRSPNGFSPYSHLGDGYIDVILIKHTTLINNVRLLLTLSRGQNEIVSSKFLSNNHIDCKITIL